MLKKNHHLTKEKKENPNSLIDFYLPTIVEGQGSIQFKISDKIFKHLSQTDEGIEKIIHFGQSCYESYLNTLWSKSMKHFLPSGLENIFTYLIENNDQQLHQKLKEKGFIKFINNCLTQTKDFRGSSSIHTIFLNKKINFSSINKDNLNIFKDWLSKYAQENNSIYSVYIHKEIKENIDANIHMLVKLTSSIMPEEENMSEFVNNFFIGMSNKKIDILSGRNSECEHTIENAFNFILEIFKNYPGLINYEFSHLVDSFFISDSDKNLINYLKENLSTENRILMTQKIIHTIETKYEYNELKNEELSYYDNFISSILLNHQCLESVKKMLSQKETIKNLALTYSTIEMLSLDKVIKSIDSISKNKQKL